MSSASRLNSLLAVGDWKTIYQTYQNANFQSYDFNNLRRIMISYIQENFPEDFNDYIESSEYIALINMISILGQNLAFRFDLNSRDNFLELAERQESVLRLARLVSYNPKRNQCATGMLKITAVSTTQVVIDVNGRNLSNQTILWNDSSNSNWYDQFIKVINSTLPATSYFGNPISSNSVGGIQTDQYRINGINTDIPVYDFSSTISGTNMNFEVVSSTVQNSVIVEETPFPGNSLSFLYQNDGAGNASPNTGFFSLFKQGVLTSSNFSVTTPTPNMFVDINSPNINNTDVWLYDLDSLGLVNNLWTQVSTAVGNNVVYNSVSKTISDIYAVITQTGDRIRLMFADGIFGAIPQGNFTVYFRTSNGLTYSINPTDITNVSVSIPYMSSTGSLETVTLTLSLQYTVSNSSIAETIASIKLNAPATYYTQNRMINGEDYNLYPMSVDQEIIKVKSINRVSSGISRYFDLTDTTGMYSTTNLFGTDGILYNELILNSTAFSYNTMNDIQNAISNVIQPILSDQSVRNLYINEFPNIIYSSQYVYNQNSSSTNISTGFISDLLLVPKPISTYSNNNLSYITIGSMIKFVPPVGMIFSSKNTLIPQSFVLPNTKPYIWAEVINVIGDGTAGGTGSLSNGTGPVILNIPIPTGSIISEVMPYYATGFTADLITTMTDLISVYKEFGLRYDQLSMSWKVITSSNLDKNSEFSLQYSGNTSNTNLDSSWVILASTTGTSYTIASRGSRYVFESNQEIRFFYDSFNQSYDSMTNQVISDSITVLSVNPQSDSPYPIGIDMPWKIVSAYTGQNGYIFTKKIVVGFSDINNDGIPDNPDQFNELVNPTVNPETKYVFEQLTTTADGSTDYQYVDNATGLILIYPSLASIYLPALIDGQLVYTISEDVVSQYTAATASFTINTNYVGFFGRSSLKFQYIHTAASSARIDPAPMNIIDTYLLTSTYDTAYRNWVSGQTQTPPVAPTSDDLYNNFASLLLPAKAISDEIIFHPVMYRNLFGPTADPTLQATFNVVKAVSSSWSSYDVVSSVLTSINTFFGLGNWDFGDTFYFGELVTYIIQQATPNISNVIIVPNLSTSSFGSLMEIQCNPDEIFISTATVNNIVVVPEITPALLRSSGNVITSVNNSNIQSN